MARAGEAVFALFEDDEAGTASLVQRGQLEPGRSLVGQMVGPHGLLNPGKET